MQIALDSSGKWWKKQQQHRKLEYKPNVQFVRTNCRHIELYIFTIKQHCQKLEWNRCRICFNVSSSIESIYHTFDSTTRTSFQTSVTTPLLKWIDKKNKLRRVHTISKFQFNSLFWESGSLETNISLLAYKRNEGLYFSQNIHSPFRLHWSFIKSSISRGHSFSMAYANILNFS